MSEIDGAVKMPADSIACPLRKADGTPCPWTYAYDAIEIEPGQLIETFAPGAIAPASKGYAAWYEQVEKLITQHLVDAHTYRDWARTMTTMRTEHHGALEQLHAGYSERINDLSERLRRAEDGRDERTRQPTDAHQKIAQLGEEAEESEVLLGRLGQLLTETASALKGESAPLSSHDWSDLPAEAAALKARVLQLEEMTAPPARSGRERYADDMIERAWGLLSAADGPAGDGGRWKAEMEEWRRDYVAGELGRSQPESTHSAP